jgi:hypothetical protein
MKNSEMCLSSGYFQLGPNNNAVAFQTVGRFERFDRCSVGFGDAA